MTRAGLWCGVVGQGMARLYHSADNDDSPRHRVRDHRSSQVKTGVYFI